MGEVFGNDVTGTVSSGGTTAPATGTSETWTINFSVAAPAASPAAGTWFYLADVAPTFESEKVQVTSCAGGTGSMSVTVKRGADGTTPIAHVTPFTVQQVITRATLRALQVGVYPMPAPSGDTSGATDTAAFKALLAAMPTITVYADPLNNTGSSATYPAGTISLQATPGAYNNPVGTSLTGTPYYFGTSGTSAGDIGNIGPFVSVLGPGDAQCRVVYLGSGDCLRSYSAVRPSDDGLGTMNAYGLGKIDNFTIDLSQATGSHPVGLHIGDQDATKLGDNLHIEHGTAGQLAPPVLVKGTTSSSGGTFGAGTYFWRVTALNAAGQETGTWNNGTWYTGTYGGEGEITATLVSTGTQAMSWAAIPNAVSYNVYRGTSSGLYPTLVANTASTSYTDTGAAGTSQSPPTATIAGATGLWIDNTVAWSEAFYGRVVLRNCAMHVRITGANGAGTLGDVSTEYNELAFKIYAMQYQQGIVLDQGAWYQHGSLKARMNMAKAPHVPFGVAALTLTGKAAAGHQGAGAYSQITASRLDIVAEANTTTANSGGSNAPMTISFGDPNQNWIIGCTGILSFEFGADWKTSNWQYSNRGTFRFLGIVSGDTVLNPAGVDFNPAYLGALLLGQGQAGGGFLYGNTGDVFQWTLNANLTLTLTQNSGAPQKKAILLSQPSGGGTYNYTVTWPTNGSPTTSSPTIIWAGGTAPTMPVGAGAWLKAELLSFDGATWYGTYEMSTGATSTSLLVMVPSGYANGTFTGPGDSQQYSNFNLADGVYPLDQNPGGSYWAFSHRKSPAHDLYIFSYNGAGGYTNALVMTQIGGVNTVQNQLDDANGNVILAGNLKVAAGTSALAPQTFQSGSLLTAAAAGAAEYDGTAFYKTGDTTSGRGLVPVEQRFRLTAAGSTISTIANYFGTTSNISLVSGGEYEIEIDCWFLKTTAGTVTWTFTNTAAPTSMTIDYQLSPATGIVTTAAATDLFGSQYNVTATAPTVVSASLTSAVNHRHRFKIRLINGTGTSLKIQATASAGSITPGINSYWKARRVPAANVGSFAT